jgi:2-polyprenyl-3-methyl-5-hydroxy-6-metoxy-1,4-benzoquinol methylase
LVLKDHHANVTFHEGDVLQTIRRNQIKFDFIILNNALEHFDEPISILSELHSLLSKEGVLFVNVPSWKGKYFLEIAAFRFNLAPFDEMEDHKRYYNKQQLWLELRNAGFLPSQIRIKSSKFGLNTSAVVCI